MLLKILESIGLTAKEAEVYKTLLRLGESPIADIIRSTGSHPQVIYRVVDTLIVKGLVLRNFRNHRAYVRAEDPKRLEELEKEKLNELQRMLPELRAIQISSKEALIRVARGNDAIYALRVRGIKELSRGEIYYVIGASGDRYYEIMGERLASWERQRIKKKIIRKLISFKSQRWLLDKNDVIRTHAEFRYLPEHHPIAASTNIFKNTVATIIWSSEPIVITIESPEVAQSYKNYFTALWDIAKP